MENFNRTCGVFLALYIRMKAPRGEAYQSAMSINASITACDMQGGSCSNIVLYIGVTKWSDNYVMTLRKLDSENNVQ